MFIAGKLVTICLVGVNVPTLREVYFCLWMLAK